MSTNTRQLARVITRPVKKLQKPRPLKTQNPSRHSIIDTANTNIFEEIMILAEAVATNLSNNNFDRNLQSNIVSLSGLLKNFGQNLEVIYKDQLDRVFVIFRNGCRNENLDYTSRLHLLELIELRAMQWTLGDGTSYYKHKYNHPDIDLLSVSSMDSSLSSGTNVFQTTQMLNCINSIVPQPLLLGPGELVKSSGKFAAPTKIPGKNYCKDEIVIRNSDSGKVMGIKGRRVHMIEELSETVISFQRVNPGAKERLVQITGPSEGKITYAKQLMEETIKRNASPVRSEMLEKEHHESNSSLNSSGSDDSSRYGCLGGARRGALAHSFSTSDATIGEYKYTVTIGDDTLKITGTNPNLVTVAKLVLDEYFLTESYDQLVSADSEEGENYFVRVNDENAEETAGVHQPSSSSSAATKTIPSKELYNPNETEASMCPDIEKPIAKQGIPTEVTSKPLKKYSMEEILFLAESPLSRKFPEDWLRMSNEFGSIVKKPPIDWFDPKSYLKERPREGDAVFSAEAIADMETPDRD